jgi:hypothetical protein
MAFRSTVPSEVSQPDAMRKPHKQWVAWAMSVAFLTLIFGCHAAFCARQIRIANGATSIVVTDAPAIEQLSYSGCNAWSGLSGESFIDHAEVGGRDVHVTWKLNAKLSAVSPREAMFVYQSIEPRLRLTWIWAVRGGQGPIEHSIKIENLGEENVWLPMQDSLALSWKLVKDQGRDQGLRHMWVEKGAGGPSDVGVHWSDVVSGYQWTGESSTYAHPTEGEQREMIPYSLIERADDGGCGWYMGIEFSGRTRISVDRRGNVLSTVAGLNPKPGPFRTLVKPGESFEPPTVFVGGFRGGADAAGNSLRRWVREELNDRATVDSPKYPLVVNNSWGSGMQIDEAQARKMIRDSAALGFEMFHLDAGWFRGVGDWYPDPKKFPHGLAPIADYAHEHGLKFGLWMDWAQASLDDHPGSLYVNDPKVRDWLVADPPPGWKQGDEFKGITIDLGVPAAHAWAVATVRRVVKEYHVDMLEHDGYVVAQGCSRSDHPHAPPAAGRLKVYEDSGFLWTSSSNDTDVSYHATRAYYDVQSQLRTFHPNLLLEICNDGGRMVDFGSAAHGDYFSISDAYDPLSNRRAFYDASYVLPPAMLETYVERWPTKNLDNFRYVLRSGMMGWFTLMLDTTEWSESEHDAARAAIELYKTKLRPLIRSADVYHVSARPDGVHWDGMEYFDASRGTGVLYAFRGSKPDEATHTFVLKGLDPKGTYRLSYEDHSLEGRDANGNELMKNGLQVRLPGINSSELVFIELKCGK